MPDKILDLKDRAVEVEIEIENLRPKLDSEEDQLAYNKKNIRELKRELRALETVLSRIYADIDRQTAMQERQAQRKAEREAREAEKQLKRAEREAKRMPEQNGIRRPKKDGLCGYIWEIADSLSKDYGHPTPIKTLLEVTRDEAINENTVKTQYARWRKFNAISGRIVLPK